MIPKSNLESNVIKFRTHLNPLSQPIEKANSFSEDFVDNDSLSLNEIINRFNRGQRLTGINYELNPNLISDQLGDDADDPDNLYPIRCDDIVDVKQAEFDLKLRKDAFESHIKEKQESQIQANTEVKVD